MIVSEGLQCPKCSISDCRADECSPAGLWRAPVGSSPNIILSSLHNHTSHHLPRAVHRIGLRQGTDPDKKNPENCPGKSLQLPCSQPAVDSGNDPQGNISPGRRVRVSAACRVPVHLEIQLSQWYNSTSIPQSRESGGHNWDHSPAGILLVLALKYN